ncbi:MAG TPA: D-alanyl-D-alanine carboxypeptidase family protein [Pyrinomonadaceae bacterium]|jgi:zinc D-Ala-D-Ala carboxypeptidase|nr:D-alanyl-D-alanine carboxypeptidase family protein [Pyrinomonadaceae bacterium]
MKNLTLVILVVVCVLAASGQSTRRKKNDASVKQVVNVSDRSSSGNTRNSAFTTAAASNVTLRNELTWTFGGKQQRGWYLYDLLINKTLDSEHDPISNDFAATLASWQKKRGLNADGVLNENSIMALVSQWQSNRLKVRTPATPDQLVTAPPSDFYDPGRAAELRQVERNTYEAYKRMIAAAAEDPSLKVGQYFKIVSAFRSREYQDELRRKSPNAGSAGLAVNNSPHFTGRALDLYVGGSPVDTRDSNRAIQVNTPAYRWLVRNAERFGFRPYFYEPWHWEYVK